MMTRDQKHCASHASLTLLWIPSGYFFIDECAYVVKVQALSELASPAFPMAIYPPSCSNESINTSVVDGVVQSLHAISWSFAVSLQFSFDYYPISKRPSSESDLKTMLPSWILPVVTIKLRSALITSANCAPRWVMPTMYFCSSDVDVESEAYRWMGSFRFTFGTIVRVIGLRHYRGRISFVPASSNASGNDTISLVCIWMENNRARKYERVNR